MSLSVVYITNEHPLYLKMALTSMGMLRTYNKTVPVRVYLIRDSSSQTIERENVIRQTGDITEHVNNFIFMCNQIGVEVCEREPLLYPDEETFFHINRKYFAEVSEPSVLYLDSDTFIFGNVKDIHDHHAYVDFAACRAVWAEGRGWRPDFLIKPVGPFSSGVMLWNNHSIRDWCDLLPRYTTEFRKNDTPLSNWLHGLHSDCLLREEFSVTKHVSQTNLVHSFIEKEDCQLIQHEQDIEDLGKSLIFHCYTPNWRKCYNKLYGRTTKKVAFGKTRKHQPLT